MSKTAAPRIRLEPPSVSLRVLREAVGLSVPGLAERIREQGVEVSDDHIRNVELGWKNPSNELLHAWARVFQIRRLDITTDQDRSRVSMAATG